MWNRGCLVLVGKDIELDAVSRHVEPYLTAGCVCMLVAPLWCDLGCCYRTVVVMKAADNLSLMRNSPYFSIIQRQKLLIKSKGQWSWEIKTILLPPLIPILICHLMQSYCLKGNFGTEGMGVWQTPDQHSLKAGNTNLLVISQEYSVRCTMP